MKKIIVKGGKKLYGSVNISTAKNSVLPIMAATILCKDKVIIQNPPLLKDVIVMCDLLTGLGNSVNMQINNNCLNIDTRSGNLNSLDETLVDKMRASVLFMGPMLATEGHCSISMPGGCKIGTRPIDLHLYGFEKLGAKINITDNYIEANAKKLTGCYIDLKYPSVGATENLIMASIGAEGITIINNAAKEPEIVDLINFLNRMGACIEGQGTNRIKVLGKTKMHGGIYNPILDRIEASTFIMAALITRSKIEITNLDIMNISAICDVTRILGGKIYNENGRFIVDGTSARNSINIKTGPYPNFPTDMQPQLMSFLCTVNGESRIEETVFENRFVHVNELIKMGANINIDNNRALISGKMNLHGAKVKATDLRAGAAMILAGLVADGTTEISDIYHIDRGYVGIEKKLKKLGAEIERTGD